MLPTMANFCSLKFKKVFTTGKICIFFHKKNADVWKIEHLLVNILGVGLVTLLLPSTKTFFEVDKTFIVNIRVFVLCFAYLEVEKKKFFSDLSKIKVIFENCNFLITLFITSSLLQKLGNRFICVYVFYRQKLWFVYERSHEWIFM